MRKEVSLGEVGRRSDTSTDSLSVIAEPQRRPMEPVETVMVGGRFVFRVELLLVFELVVGKSAARFSNWTVQPA
jgi:hypothetical protein